MYNSNMLTIYLTIYPTNELDNYQSVCLSACLPACLDVCMYVYRCIYIDYPYVYKTVLYMVPCLVFTTPPNTLNYYVF